MCGIGGPGVGGKTMREDGACFVIGFNDEDEKDQT